MSTSPSTHTVTSAPFTITTDLPVSPDEAFELITQPERLRRWKTVSASVDLRAGGSYRFTVLPGHIAAGTYREIEPGRRLVFGWGWEGSDELPPDASTVTVTIEPTDGGSRVTLVHEGLDAEQAASHAEGWRHFFERLDRLAATGDAGPDEWASAPDPIDPIIASEAALAAIQPVLRGLTAADRQKATPCADYTCHDLAEHLMTSMVDLGAMAGAEVTRPEHGGLEVKVSEMADQAITAWRTRGLEGTVATPNGFEMPASLGASILAVEILLHGWDLAQGSGQRLVASDPLVEYVRGLAEQVVPGGRGSSFGDELEPHPDADALERLAAYAGRSPLPAA
jgi:uncharacterized protein (TIGR03086 family)